MKIAIFVVSVFLAVAQAAPTELNERSVEIAECPFGQVSWWHGLPYLRS